AGDGRPRAGTVGAVAVGAAGHAGQRAAGAGFDLLGEGRPPDLVLGAECAVDDGGQVLPHVDAVDHLLQLDRIPALVEALVRVAELAEADLSPPPAVKGQGVVATVALGRGGELAGERDGPAGRHEVEQWVRIQLLRLEGALDLAPDRVRGRGREAGGQRGGERVRVDAPRCVHGGERAAGVVSGLTGRRNDVATIAREGGGGAFGRRGLKVEMCDGEPDARLRRIRGRGGGGDQRDAGAVGQGEGDRDDALRAHRRGRDLRHQTGAGQARRDGRERRAGTRRRRGRRRAAGDGGGHAGQPVGVRVALTARLGGRSERPRSEEHTSELQSLPTISYAVFCLKKKKKKKNNPNIKYHIQKKKKKNS